MEDDGNVNVFDEVVVLVRSGSDLDTTDEYIFDNSCLVVGLDGGEKLGQVGISLDVKTGVPLSVLVEKGNGSACGELGVDIGGCLGCGTHGKMRNEEEEEAWGRVSLLCTAKRGGEQRSCERYLVGHFNPNPTSTSTSTHE